MRLTNGSPMRSSIIKDVAAKVIADVRADIDDLSGQQVVQLAHHYFAIERAWNGG
jgi:hypothetical protein